MYPPADSASGHSPCGSPWSGQSGLRGALWKMSPHCCRATSHYQHFVQDVQVLEQKHIQRNACNWNRLGARYFELITITKYHPDKSPQPHSTVLTELSRLFPAHESQWDDEVIMISLLGPDNNVSHQHAQHCRTRLQPDLSPDPRRVNLGL